jgi:hypothetical protein
MAYIARRRLLQNSFTAAVGCSAAFLLRNSLFAQTSPNASTRVYLDTRRALAPLDRNIFGSFLEHHPQSQAENLPNDSCHLPLVLHAFG